MRRAVLVGWCWIVACQTPIAAGAPCTRNGECPSPLVCRIGRCRNECTEQRDCPAGQRCLLDADRLGACSVDIDVCTESAQCGGLICIDGACENACTTIESCAPGSSCEVGASGRARCVRAPESDGGDAGPADAAVRVDAGNGPCGHALDAIAIAVGVDHSCAIARGGAIYCWGLNREGQLGDGGATPVTHRSCAASVDCSASPVAVQAGTAIVATAIGAGQRHTCARLQSGEVICWGDGRGGQRGTDTASAPFGATRVVEGASAVSASDRATLWGNDLDSYVLDEGTVLGWGEGARGALGATVTPDARVEELASSITLAAGESFVCGAVSGATQASCLGTNTHGVLGTSLAIGASTNAVATVPFSADVLELVAGAGHLCARTTTSVECLGHNDELQLGRDTAGATEVSTAAAVDGTTSPFERLFSGPGASGTCGLRAGRLWCWGGNGNGELGQPTTMPTVATPTAILTLDHVIAAGIGGDHACALTDVGAVYCWGAGELGQLGNGTLPTTPTDVPQRVCLD